MYCVAMDDESRGMIQALTYDLRKAGVSAECDTAGRGFKSQMKAAGACRFACIVGADERANNAVTVKNLADGTQVNISVDETVKYIMERV